MVAAAASNTEWTFCVEENSRCTVSSNQAVRFGMSDRWVSKNLDWASSCDVNTFGDPPPGQVKHCEVAGIWEFCANENQQCGFGDA